MGFWPLCGKKNAPKRLIKTNKKNGSKASLVLGSRHERIPELIAESPLISELASNIYLLLAVFSFLPLESLIQCMMTCKNFNHVIRNYTAVHAKDHMLIGEMIFDVRFRKVVSLTLNAGDIPSREVANHLLFWRPSLRDLTLTECDTSHHEDICNAIACLTLENLVITDRCFEFPEEFVKILGSFNAKNLTLQCRKVPTILRLNPNMNVKSLTLQGFSLDAESIHQFKALLQKPCSIDKIRITGCTFSGDSDENAYYFEHCLLLMMKMNLKSLKFDSNILLSEGVDSNFNLDDLSKMLKTNSNLKKFSFTTKNIFSPVLERIFYEFHEYQQLEHLHLFGNPTTILCERMDDEIEKLCEAYKTCRLKSLHLDNLHFSSQNQCYFFTHTQVSHMILQSCEIPNNSVPFMNKNLQSLTVRDGIPTPLLIAIQNADFTPALRVLKLHNFISSENLLITKLIQKCSNLEEFHIIDVKSINTWKEDDIINAIRELKHLKKLTLVDFHLRKELKSTVCTIFSCPSLREVVLNNIFYHLTLQETEEIFDSIATRLASHPSMEKFMCRNLSQNLFFEDFSRIFHLVKECKILL